MFSVVEVCEEAADARSVISSTATEQTLLTCCLQRPSRMTDCVETKCQLMAYAQPEKRQTHLVSIHRQATNRAVIQEAKHKPMRDRCRSSVGIVFLYEVIIRLCD